MVEQVIPVRASRYKSKRMVKTCFRLVTDRIKRCLKREHPLDDLPLLTIKFYVKFILTSSVYVFLKSKLSPIKINSGRRVEVKL